jgi:hypothetical protein
MNTLELKNALDSLVAANDSIEVRPQTLGGQECYELAWQRNGGNQGYIDVYPQQNEVLVVQYGTFDHRGDRHPAGMTRWRCGKDLLNNLSKLKQALDQVQPTAEVAYSPAPRISSVSSLKLR